MLLLSVFFFNAPATTEFYTLSLHDALPIWQEDVFGAAAGQSPSAYFGSEIGENYIALPPLRRTDRKSTRLNSSHVAISYAVFCLKKKKLEKSNNDKKFKSI